MITATKKEAKPIAPKAVNRELWLQNAVDMLKPIFKEKANVTIPFDVNVSTGFPSAKGVSSKQKTIGQCWTREASDAKINEIYINPCIDDSIKVLDILAHELVHASDNCESGHRGFFARVARAIGLEGKLTATHAGEALADDLKAIIDQIGEFPHSKLNPSIGIKKQGTRLIKIGCDCGVIGRMSQSAIDGMSWDCSTCDQKVSEVE